MAQLKSAAGDSGSRKSGNGLHGMSVARIVPAPAAARERKLFFADRAGLVLNPRRGLQRIASARLLRPLPVQYRLHSFRVVRFRSFGYRCRQPHVSTAPLQILKGHF